MLSAAAMVTLKNLELISRYQLGTVALAGGLCMAFVPVLALSTVLGGALMAANFALLKWLMQRAMRGQKNATLYIILLMTKLFAVLAIIGLLLHYSLIQPLGFVLGLATLFVAMLFAAIHATLQTNTSNNTEA